MSEGRHTVAPKQRCVRERRGTVRPSCRAYQNTVACVRGHCLKVRTRSRAVKRLWWARRRSPLRSSFVVCCRLGPCFTCARARVLFVCATNSSSHLQTTSTNKPVPHRLSSSSSPLFIRPFSFSSKPSLGSPPPALCSFPSPSYSLPAPVPLNLPRLPWRTEMKAAEERSVLL